MLLVARFKSQDSDTLGVRLLDECDDERVGDTGAPVLRPDEERLELAGAVRDLDARDTHQLQLKCQGLDAEQLAARPVPTSALSLHGLLRHLADEERS